MSTIPYEPVKATILVVDDTPDNLALMFNLLKDTYRVKGAANGENALMIARNVSPPDLVLLDIMMPGLSGYDVCRLLKADPQTCHIPVIFLTAMGEVEDEEQGLVLGAVDYITKPIRPSIVLARIKTHLENKAARDFLKDQNLFLEREVVRRTQEVTAFQHVTILAMASLAETRDNETGNHIRRTQHYIRVLAERLKTHPRFSDYLTEQQIELLYRSAPLHDIGKVGIPDSILLKPDRLTPDEFTVMKRHTTLGLSAIEHAETEFGMSVQFLDCAKQMTIGHHEKWDGSGYPYGLVGEDIPICARLMALADVYDALISWRVYKRSMPHEQALSIIFEGRGTHFDPDIADAFIACGDEIQAIARRFRDAETADAIS